MARALQVEPFAASAQAQQHHVHLRVRLEGPQHRVALRRRQRPHQLDRPESELLEPPLHDVQEVHVLREDDGLVVRRLFLHCLQRRHELLELGGGRKLGHVHPMEERASPRLGPGHSRGCGCGCGRSLRPTLPGRLALVVVVVVVVAPGYLVACSQAD